MNKILVFCALIAVVYATPIPSIRSELIARRILPALQHQEIHDEYGQFALRYVTAEGTVVTERGRLVLNPDGRTYVLIMEGEFSYYGDDGKIHITKYTSGFDGYKPELIELPILPVLNKAL